jgi:hypothetical protein
MKSNNINFILDIIKEINFKLDINLPIINQINFIDIRNTYKKNIDKLQNFNFDKDISNLYNDSIDNILNNNLQINKFINVNFYSKNIISKFISSRIIRNIINNLFIKTEYILNKDRIIIIYSKYNFIDNKLINKIDSILNFFDYLMNKKNYFKIEIYLSNEKKKIDMNNNFLGVDNINSGMTLPGYYIILFRKEEIIKVLFHEIIHYLDLDMKYNQNDLLILYNDINLKADMINPNEAYTEVLALLFLNIWEYHYENKKINNFINCKLNIELYWSFIQITKILKFFKYESFDDLFTKNNVFYQKTNVLSYFFLKTVFLLNINDIFNDLTLNNIYFNKNRLEIIKKSNLKQLKEYIDIIYFKYNNNNFDKETLRMTIYG